MSLIFTTLSDLITLSERQSFAQTICQKAKCLGNSDKTPWFIFELTTMHAQWIACILEQINWLQMCSVSFQVHKQDQPGITTTLKAEPALKKRSYDKKNMNKKENILEGTTSIAYQEAFVSLLAVKHKA